MAAGSGAIALVAVLTACSGTSDSPTVLPAVSTTPAASSSTAPTQAPKAAAVAVVKQYFHLLNNLEQTMNAEAFARLETPGCPCHKFVKSVSDVRAKGQHYFGHATITSLTATIDSHVEVEVLVSYDSTPGGIKDRNGRVISQSPGLIGATENFYVKQVAGRWLVRSILSVRAGKSQ